MSHPWSQPSRLQPQLQLEQQFDLVPGGLDGQIQRQNMFQQPQTSRQQPGLFLTGDYSAGAQFPRPLSGSFSQNAINHGRRAPSASGSNERQSDQFTPLDAIRSTARSYQTNPVAFNPNLAFFGGNANASQSYSSNSPPFGDIGASPNDSLLRSPPSISSSPDMLQANYGAVPPVGLVNEHSSYYQSFPTESDLFSFPAQNVRKRIRDDDFDDEAPELETGPNPTSRSAAGETKRRACTACKGLKIKCEWRPELESCARCNKQNLSCQIPDHKKRRTPPKREHLLNQIRDQAAQIQKLMAELEISQNTHLRSSTQSANGLRMKEEGDMESPILDSDDPSQQALQIDGAEPEVKDWIAKARQSLEAFDGYVGVAGIPKSMLVEEDPEESDSSDGQDEYDIAIEGGSEGGDEGDPVLINDAGRSEGRRTLSRDTTDRRARSLSNGAVHKKDSSIDKLANLPPEAAPLGLIAKFAVKSTSRRNSNDEEAENGVGLMNDNFYKASSTGPDPMRGPSPVQMPPYWNAPHILVRGIVTPAEAEKLFKIYFEYMNLSVSLLDPVLYTPQRTICRSPFLFTVVCAIASRYYAERPELYNKVMHYARLAAGSALIDGLKTVEMVQAYILLSLYPVPARRWECDRRWLYLGLAIRVATDLNLHHPITAKPVNEAHAREMLNRTRVWLNCFNLDRSTGSEYGKPPIIKNSDYVANHSETWFESSPYNLKHFDIHLCAYNAELKVMAKFGEKIYSNPDHPTGLNKEVDFEKIASETDDQLKALGEEWISRIEKTDQTDPQNRFRTGLLRLAYSYARLVSLSFGFQHAFGKNGPGENPFLQRCLSAASDVVNYVVHDIGRPSQRIYLRHGPEAQSTFTTFAATFLVKLLQPKFSEYLSMEQRLQIRSQVQSVVDLLGSHEVAIDNKHGPKLYARFLRRLLAAPMAKVEAHASVQRPLSVSAPNRQPRPPRPSTSPDRDHIQERGTTGGLLASAAADAASPESNSSLSPPPNQAATSFDHFAPVTAGIDPFNHYINIDPDTSDYGMFAPLPYDEILGSLTDPNEWPADMNFNQWMGNTTDVHMQTLDPVFTFA